MHNQAALDGFFSHVWRPVPSVCDDVHNFAGLGQKTGHVPNVRANPARRVRGWRILAANEEMCQTSPSARIP